MFTQVNSTHMFFGGGNSGYGRAYLVDVPNWTWTKLPDSKYYREDASCGRAGRLIVAAGGNGAAASNTEVLNLDTLQWKKIPSIPSDGSYIKLSTSVYQTEETFAVVSGKSGGWRRQSLVWEFDPELLKWERSDLPEVEVARSSHVVVPVPESVTCA